MIIMTGTAAANNNDTDLRPNRERWLEAAIDTYWRPRFVEVGYPLPERFHVSVGFGYAAKRENAKLMGQCWSRIQSADGVPHIFVSPEIDDTAEVLRVLGHELIHSALDSDEGIMDGHVKRFAEIATRLGFEGRMTETPASLELIAELFTVAEALGEYPHGALHVKVTQVVLAGTPTDWRKGGGRVHTGPPAQSNRHIALQCPCCGYRVRTTAKWIALGVPRCPAGTDMSVIS
jgi:hypothetical protein